MTKPNDDLRTNDEPQRILLEASARMKACYPEGTKIDVLISIGNIRLNNATVFYDGLGRFYVVCERGLMHNFCPATDPHKVLP